MIPHRSRFRPRAALARAHQILREHGWRVLVWRTLGWLGLRRVVLYEWDFDPLSGSTPTPFTVAPLAEDELDEYLAHRPEPRLAEVERRLRAGDSCHVARIDGRIVSSLWCTTREIAIGYLGYRARLAEGQAFLYDAYTVPEQRRKGATRALTVAILARLREEGVREVFGAADPANRAGTAVSRSDANAIAVLVSVGLRRRFLLRLPVRRASPSGGSARPSITFLRSSAHDDATTRSASYDENPISSNGARLA
jgi:GNAT superfamily N-acetyltransferase